MPLSRLDLPRIVEAIQELYRTIEHPPGNNWQAPAWLIEQYEHTTLGGASVREVKNPAHSWLIGAAATEVQNRITAPDYHAKKNCPEITESSLDQRHKVALLDLWQLLLSWPLGNTLASNRSEAIRVLGFLQDVLKELTAEQELPTGEVLSQSEANGIQRFLADFQDAYATYSSSSLILAILSCPGKSVQMPPELMPDGKMLYGSFIHLGEVTAKDPSTGEPAHFLIALLADCSQAMERFRELSRRAGAFLPASLATSLNLVAQYNPEALWVLFVFRWTEGAGFVLQRGGYHILRNPFAASARAIEFSALEEAPRKANDNEGGTRRSKKAKPKGKRKGGRKPLKESDPLKFQVYERIKRERDAGTRPCKIVERLKDDKDFVEQVKEAGLKLDKKLVKNALACLNPRK